MPQFFLNPSELQQPTVTIRGKEARHLQEVLHLQPGDWVVLCDGAGCRYRAEITASRPLHVQLRRGELLPLIQLPAQVTLAAAVIRPQRFDWLVEKVFELGCRRLIPLSTERTVAHYIKDAPKQQKRWSEIALSAAKQSGLPWQPEVDAVTPLADVLKNVQGKLVYCWEGLALSSDGKEGAGGAERGPHFRQQPSHAAENIRWVAEGDADKWGASATGPAPYLILIGPEGGFSTAEHEMIMTHPPTLLPLGPLILRSETAAITALVKTLQSPLPSGEG